MTYFRAAAIWLEPETGFGGVVSDVQSSLFTKLLVVAITWIMASLKYLRYLVTF